MKKILFILGFVLLLPVAVLSSIGVGVGTGKIYVQEKLKPGIIYDLPSFAVLNTGDEQADYEVAVEFNETQPELKPEREWFAFEPKEFTLSPGQAKEVKITLNLPIKNLKPGDYFAYLEARPSQKAESGQTRIGIAAASKLYFTVAPSNLFAGIYYRIISLFKLLSPWSYIVPSLVLFVAMILILRKYVSFSIGINVKRNE